MATVPAIKQSFLAAQTQLLTQSLAPSRTWLAGNSDSERPIPERLVQEALASVNQTLLQHGRRVWAPLASRNVSEQIEELYGREEEAGEEGKVEGRDDGRRGEHGRGGIGRGIDFTQQQAVDELPEEWPEKEAHEHPAEAHHYRSTIMRLRELSQRREDLAARVERLKRLGTTVEALRTESGGVGVQENLATRGGALERELERTRLLMVRVAGRVGALPGRAGGEDGSRNGAEDGRGMDIDALLAEGGKGVEEFLSGERMFGSR